MTTRPVAVRVSQATRLVESSVRQASRMASEIWSAILSGWPSVTDSEVNKIRFLADNLCVSLLDPSLRAHGCVPGGVSRSSHRSCFIPAETSFGLVLLAGSTELHALAASDSMERKPLEKAIRGDARTQRVWA